MVTAFKSYKKGPLCFESLPTYDFLRYFLITGNQLTTFLISSLFQLCLLIVLIN